MNTENKSEDDAVKTSTKVSQWQTIFANQRQLVNHQLAVETVSNITTVVSLGCEKTFCDTYVGLLLPHHKRAKRITHVRALVIGVARSLMFFPYSACVYYGGILIRDEGLRYENVFK